MKVTQCWYGEFDRAEWAADSVLTVIAHPTEPGELIIIEGEYGSSLTPWALAKREISALVEEGAHELELDDRGYPKSYLRASGERIPFDPWWNGFDHPLSFIPQPIAEPLAIAACEIIGDLIPKIFGRDMYKCGILM